MKNKYVYRNVALSIFAFIVFINGNAQVEVSSELYKTIKKIDSIVFDNGFNNCMISEIKPYISEDLEFYHDKAGLSTTGQEFFTALEQNICSNLDEKPLRKLVEGSMQVFPLYNNEVLYGAIPNGVHKFYIKEANKEAYLTSTAKFTHVYIIQNHIWKLKRVLSYDHQQPTYKGLDVKEILVSDAILMQYVGEYKSQHVSASISKKDKALQMVSGEMKLTILPQSETLFFSKEAPLTFEFVKNADSKVVKMIVRENGKIVDEVERVK